MIHITGYTFLVFDTVDDRPTLLGGPLFICGRATVDVAADLVTVRSSSGAVQSTQIAGSDPRLLARTMLREIARQRV